MLPPELTPTVPFKILPASPQGHDAPSVIFRADDDRLIQVRCRRSGLGLESRVLQQDETEFPGCEGVWFACSNVAWGRSGYSLIPHEIQQMVARLEADWAMGWTIDWPSLIALDWIESLELQEVA